MPALPRIQADLGNQIEILRRPSEIQPSTIEVVGTGLTLSRRRQGKDALADLPRVTVRFEDPQAQAGKPLRPAGSTTVPPATGGLRDELEEPLGCACRYAPVGHASRGA